MTALGISSSPPAAGKPSIDTSAAYVAAVALVVVGASAFNILPLLADGVVLSFKLSSRAVAATSVVISASGGLSALIGGAWIRSIPWSRAAALALSIMFAANCVAIAARAFPTFVIAEGISGLCGGSVLCLALTMLSDRKDPARAFGLANAAQVAFQVTGMAAGPMVLRTAGLRGVLLLLATLSGLAILLVPMIPAKGRVFGTPRSPKSPLQPLTLLALIGVATYFANAGAYWTYIELMARAAGLTIANISICMAAGVSMGMAGGLLACMQGAKCGERKPLLVATLCTTAAALAIRGHFGLEAFAFSGLTYFFAWNYAVAYQLAAINIIDQSGRAIAVAGACSYLGAAGGAALAGLLVAPGEYDSVVWVTVGFACVGNGLIALAAKMRARTTACPDSYLAS